MFKKLFLLFKELERQAPRPKNISLLRDETGNISGKYYLCIAVLCAGAPVISSINGKHGGKLGRM